MSVDSRAASGRGRCTTALMISAHPHGMTRTASIRTAGRHDRRSITVHVSAIRDTSTAPPGPNAELTVSATTSASPFASPCTAATMRTSVADHDGAATIAHPATSVTVRAAAAPAVAIRQRGRGRSGVAIR